MKSTSGNSLLNAKGDELNIELFTVLTHTSIASLSAPYDFMTVNVDVGETREQKEREVEMWSLYVREFSVFYFDLFVEYVQALIQQGVYSLDDVVVFNDVLGKSISL